MIVYFAALIPLYIVVWLPLSNLLWGSTPAPRRTGLSNQRLRNGSFIALEDDAPDAPARVCPEHKYATYILNQEPLVAYIEGFLSAEESAHLVAVRYISLFPPASLLRSTLPLSGAVEGSRGSIRLFPALVRHMTKLTSSPANPSTRPQT
jgi:hypothetical protein